MSDRIPVSNRIPVSGRVAASNRTSVVNNNNIFSVKILRNEPEPGVSSLNNTGITGTQAFSMAINVNVYSTINDNRSFLMIGDGSGGVFMGVNPEGKFLLYVFGLDLIQLGKDLMGKFTRCVFTYAGGVNGDIEVWADGVKVISFPYTMGNNDTKLVVGNATHYTIGTACYITDAYLWNRKLTDIEIAAYSANGTAPASGMVIGYTFLEGTGSTTADVSGNGNTGEFTPGAVWYAFAPPRHRISRIPNSVSGLVGWYKGETELELDSFGLVHTISDISRNRNSAIQTTEANRPLIESSVQNGRPSLNFYKNGFNLSAVTRGFTLTQPMTVFVTLKMLINTPGVLFDAASGGVRIIGVTDYVTLRVKVANDVAITVPTLSQFRVLTIVLNGASTKIRVDGVDIATIDVGASDAAVGLTIGSLTDGTTGFQGYMPEALVYSGVKTATEISQIENYLKAEWNIS